MKRLKGYARSYWGWIMLSVMSGLGCSAANVYIVDLLKRVIDLSISKKMDFTLWELAVQSAAAILTGMAANYLLTKITGTLGAVILRDLRHDMAAHIMNVSPCDMERQSFGDIMERLSSDIETVAGYMETYFKDCIYVPVLVIVFAIYLANMNSLLAALCLGPLLLMVPVSIKLLKPVKMAQAEYVKKLGLTNNHIQEACDGAEAIKAYNLQQRMLNRYQNALNDTLDISNKNDLRQYNIEPLSALIREAPTAIALCAGGYLALKGELTIGILVAFISGIKKINEPLVYAYQLVVRTQMAMISVNRVLEILEIPEECNRDISEKIRKSSEMAFEVKNVSFCYKNANEDTNKNANKDENKDANKDANENTNENVKDRKPVLEQFSLSVYEGRKIAIVGKSGCGKSTIIKLLCRQIEADEGEIYFYGNSFKDLAPASVREQIAIITQEPMIFPMSVADNIRIGKPEASEEEIIEASKKAGCHKFIIGLQNGYETLLEERGDNLSGGQRQRIAIARSILKDAPIILMDEPTSALDAETEKYVNKTLLAISENKTLITIAHRLNTVVDYDEIIVLEEGKIVETGNHSALMSNRGKYREMYNEYIQAGGIGG